MKFRAIWPIKDESVGYTELLTEAKEQLPLIIAQARAELIKPGRFTIARSEAVPGSGRVTPSVLVFEALARPAEARDYHARIGGLR